MNKLLSQLVLLASWTGIRASRSASVKGRLAGIMWFRPPRKAPHEHYVSLSASALSQTLSFGDHGTVVRTWGELNSGPHVVLIHGWAGRWDQFASLIPHLVGRNYVVSAFDFPAHGEAGGMSTDLLQWRSVLRDVQRYLGETELVFVCHSFGFTAVAQAILAGEARAKAVIAINPATGLDFLLEAFARKLRLDEDVVPHLARSVESRVPAVRSITDFELDALVRKVPVLYFADRDDRQVPFERHASASRLLGDNFIASEGFGHNRVLHDPAFHRTLSDFLPVSSGWAAR